MPGFFLSNNHVYFKPSDFEGFKKHEYLNGFIGQPKNRLKVTKQLVIVTYAKMVSNERLKHR